MTLKAIPINMVAAPNSWAPTKETFWVVTDAMATDLWGQLIIVDSMGSRPYVPKIGSGLQAVFQRGDYIGNVTSQNLTVTKAGVLDADFRAIFKLPLTAQDATNIISGTIVFTLTEGAVVQKWSQNWAVKKLNTSAGF
jgi:hypothetical protein